jgi:hypothetical protein
MNETFDWCVRVLVHYADVLGITYKEINVWIFVILWPLLTIGMTALILVQRARIRRLEARLLEQQVDNSKSERK